MNGIIVKDKDIAIEGPVLRLRPKIMTVGTTMVGSDSDYVEHWRWGGCYVAACSANDRRIDYLHHPCSHRHTDSFQLHERICIEERDIENV